MTNRIDPRALVQRIAKQLSVAPTEHMLRSIAEGVAPTLAALEQAREALAENHAALETCMAWFGEQMTSEDRRTRGLTLEAGTRAIATIDALEGPTLPTDWRCPSCRTRKATVSSRGLVTCENSHESR